MRYGRQISKLMLYSFLLHTVITLMMDIAVAITESDSTIGLESANSSKERPKMAQYDLDEATASQVEEQSEGFNFNADVARLMDIVINSLYQRKEVFIRELISNASDALDKARFMSVQDADYLKEKEELEIMIDFDYEAKTISITDTGVGMTKAELIKNLGTVAKSGTTAFIEAIGASQSSDSMSMIGQFGVGFYASFLVANKVQVISKSPEDDQHIWTSSADASFSVAKDPRGDTLGRGTRVTLFLKDEAIEFVEQDKIRNLVKKHSEFINYPISLYASYTTSEEVPDDEEDTEGVTIEKGLTDESEVENSDMEVTSEEEGDMDEIKEPKMKTVTKENWDWELLNDIKAIWLRPKDEIEDHEYKEFYKSISKDHNDPLAWTHFKAEGEIDFKAILFVPRETPSDLYDNYYSKSAALKLYVRRVLIMEEFEDLMPRYLSFVKGVVDSDDLPLNISREQLQQMKMLKVMHKKLVKKTLDMIKDLAEASYEYEDEEEKATDEETEEKKENEEKKETVDGEEVEIDEDKEEEEDKYDVFWEQFGKNIKLGVMEDSVNRMKLAKLLRFYSTYDQEDRTSLDEYISRMKEDQDTILYLPGDSKKGILKSPIMKRYVKAGYEILILDDPIDEFVFQHVTEYEKKKIKSIAKDDLNILDNTDLDKKKNNKLKDMYKPLTDWFKKHLGSDVSKVQVSSKLGDEPIFIFTGQFGYSAQMEKINKAQAFQSGQQGPPQYMMARKTLEINPHHPVMRQLLEKIKGSEDGETLDEASTSYCDLLYYMALLNSGFGIDEPTDLTGPLEKLVRVGFGIERDAVVEEIEVEIDEDENETEEPENEGEFGGNDYQIDWDSAEFADPPPGFGSDEL